MSRFPTQMNVSAAMQTLSQSQPVVAKQASGWDNFLSGVGRAGTNFMLGVASGLSNYDPRNPFSSMGAGMSGAMSGIYAGMKREEASKNALAIANTQEQIASSQAERASVLMPAEGPMQGIGTGVMQPAPVKPAPEPFDFQTGMFPSLGQQEPTTASSKVRNLMLGTNR